MTQRSENKRNSIRVAMEGNFESYLSIKEINGSKVNTKRKAIDIVDVSQEGILFRTDLNFPVSRSVILGFEIYLQHNNHNIPFVLKGYIVWKQKGKDGYYYGIHFINDDPSRKLYTYMFDKQALDLHLMKINAYEYAMEGDLLPASTIDIVM